MSDNVQPFVPKEFKKVPQSQDLLEALTLVSQQLTSLHDRMDRRQEEIVQIRVSLGVLESKLAQTNTTTTGLLVSIDKINEKMETVFHIRAFGKGVLAPLTVLATIALFGIGEFVRQTIDKIYHH